MKDNFLVRNSMEIIRIILYSIFLVELIYFGIIKEFLFVFFMLTIIFILFIARVALFGKSDLQWDFLKEILEKIVPQNDKELEDHDELLATDPSLEQQFQLIEENKQLKDYSSLTDQFKFVTNPQLEEIRKTGVDGLLVLIFLLKYSSIPMTIKSINSALSLPTSSLYRQITKLIEEKYIATIRIIEKPNTAFYMISEKGKSVIIELYDFINISSIPELNELTSHE